MSQNSSWLIDHSFDLVEEAATQNQPPTIVKDCLAFARDQVYAGLNKLTKDAGDLRSRIAELEVELQITRYQDGRRTEMTVPQRRDSESAQFDDRSVAALTAQLQAERDAHAALKEELNTRTREFETKIRAQSAELKGLSTPVAPGMQEVARLRTDLAKMTQQLATQSETLAAASEQLATESDALASTNQKLVDAAAANRRLLGENAELKLRAARSSKAAKNLRTQRDEALARVEESAQTREKAVFLRKQLEAYLKELPVSAKTVAISENLAESSRETKRARVREVASSPETDDEDDEDFAPTEPSNKRARWNRSNDSYDDDTDDQKDDKDHVRARRPKKRARGQIQPLLCICRHKCPHTQMYHRHPALHLSHCLIYSTSANCLSHEQSPKAHAFCHPDHCPMWSATQPDGEVPDLPLQMPTHAQLCHWIPYLTNRRSVGCKSQFYAITTKFLRSSAGSKYARFRSDDPYAELDDPTYLISVFSDGRYPGKEFGDIPATGKQWFQYLNQFEAKNALQSPVSTSDEEAIESAGGDLRKGRYEVGVEVKDEREEGNGGDEPEEVAVVR